MMLELRGRFKDVPAASVPIVDTVFEDVNVYRQIAG
jgi:hypothetical protein